MLQCARAIRRESCLMENQVHADRFMKLLQMNTLTQFQLNVKVCHSKPPMKRRNGANANQLNYICQSEKFDMIFD